MFTREEFLNYRCPRWNDWPNIGLYMDQVISILEEQVAGFYPPDQTKLVTSTMINNYVKHKIVVSSQKKKYKRGHLAHLYILFLLKPVLSLTDICDGVNYLTKDREFEECYDIFCDELEIALKNAFDDKNKAIISNNKNIEDIEIMQAITNSFSYTMLARYYFNNKK